MKNYICLLLCFISFFFVITIAEAAPLTPTGTSTSNIGTSTVTYSWEWGGGTEVFYAVASSTDGATFASNPTVITPTTTLSFNYTGLAPNTRYWVVVFSGTNGTTFSALATSSPFYTLANPALAPTVNSPATSTLNITINANSNPTASTTYAIYNVTTSKYLTVAGVESDTISYFKSTDWTGSAISLTPNTSYQFSVVARNGDGINAATSSASTAIYTAADIPTLSVIANNSTKITASFSGAGSGVEYYVENITTATSSGWISASSYAFENLSCGTTYQFRVQARNTDLVVGSWSSTVTTNTASCASSGGGSGFANTSPLTNQPAPAIKAPKLVLTFNLPLNLGSRGKEVAALQNRLIAEGFLTGKATGYYGKATVAAVKAYQKAHGLRALGSIGPATRAELNKNNNDARSSLILQIQTLLQQVKELQAKIKTTGN